MSQRRLARVANAIKQVVSQAILTEMRDPRARSITVLAVEVPEDLRSAKVYVSIMGEAKAERLSLQGLNAARGWLQQRIAEELDLRWTPILSFVVDPGVKKSLEISRTLREAVPMNVTDEEASESEGPEAQASEQDLTDDESLERAAAERDGAAPGGDAAEHEEPSPHRE